MPPCSNSLDSFDFAMRHQAHPTISCILTLIEAAIYFQVIPTCHLLAWLVIGLLLLTTSAYQILFRSYSTPLLNVLLYLIGEADLVTTRDGEQQLQTSLAASRKKEEELQTSLTARITKERILQDLLVRPLINVHDVVEA